MINRGPLVRKPGIPPDHQKRFGGNRQFSTGSLSCSCKKYLNIRVLYPSDHHVIVWNESGNDAGRRVLIVQKQMRAMTPDQVMVKIGELKKMCICPECPTSNECAKKLKRNALLLYGAQLPLHYGK